MDRKNLINNIEFKSSETILKPKWSVKSKTKNQNELKQSSIHSKNPGLASHRLREKMVQRLRSQGIEDELVLKALATVERHRFVDSALASRAYEDTALPIGSGQTISQPYVVARVISIVRTLLLKSKIKQKIPHVKKTKVLEVGTGCGYQAIVMSNCFDIVYSIERVNSLYKSTINRCDNLLSKNLNFLFGDGANGLPDKAPFDAIIFSAAMVKFPKNLISQLRVGGLLLLPEGNLEQRLLAGVKVDEKNDVEFYQFDAVRYVPVQRGVEI